MKYINMNGWILHISCNGDADMVEMPLKWFGTFPFHFLDNERRNFEFNMTKKRNERLNDDERAAQRTQARTDRHKDDK